jgi:hypothetical protein
MVVEGPCTTRSEPRPVQQSSPGQGLPSAPGRIRGMTPRLQRALDEVDRVFGDFTCAADNPCTHCYGDDGVPELEVSGAQIDRATLSSLAYEAPSILADHDAMVRRILPQVARGMADGTVHLLDGGGSTLPDTLWLARLACAATGRDHRVCCRLVGGPDHHT